METETFAGKAVSRTYNQYPDFEVGDLVRLKSGGPNMTVDNASSSRITCVWFEGEQYNMRNFDQGAIEKVPAKDSDLSLA